jgi:hypothetical protein
MLDFCKPEIFITEKAESMLKEKAPEIELVLRREINKIAEKGMPLEYFYSCPASQKRQWIYGSVAGIQINLLFPDENRDRLHIVISGFGDGRADGPLDHKQFKPYCIMTV